MSCLKRHTVGKPCGCTNACNSTCFTVRACGANANAATVSVYGTNATNTILASGNTNSAGVVCLDLSNYATGWSLEASASAGTNSNDYASSTVQILGSPCGRSFTMNLSPKTDTNTGGETNGTVNVLFTQCDGTTAWANATAEVKVSFDVINSCTTATNGRCSVVVTADNSNAYYVRVVRPSDNSTLNSDTFTLPAGKCADAHMRMTNSFLPCDPTVEAVITVRDCTAGTPGGPRVCCSACSPDTLPNALYLDDSVGIQATPGTCPGTVSYSDVLMVQGWQINPLGWGVGDGWGIAVAPGTTSGTVQRIAPYYGCCPTTGSIAYYSMSCGTTVPRLSYTISGVCQTTSGGDFLSYRGSVTGAVDATTHTCDPFSATFTIPSFTLTCCRNPIFGMPCNPCTNITIPSRTVTITQ